MSFIENLGYILVGFVIIISLFLIILALLEKKLHIRFLRGRHWKNQLYITKISKINVNETEQGTKILDKIAKSFFREAFHIQGAPEYSELETIFKKRNNKKAIKFSNEMTKYLYSKQKITKDKLYELIILLADIIGGNRIITKDEKKELDKKSQEKKLFLRQINIPGIGKEKFKKKQHQSKQ